MDQFYPLLISSAWLAVQGHPLHARHNAGLGRTAFGYALIAYAQRTWKMPCLIVGAEPDWAWAEQLGVVKNLTCWQPCFSTQTGWRLIFVDVPVQFADRLDIHAYRDDTAGRGTSVVWAEASEDVLALCSMQVQVAGLSGRHLLASISGNPVKRVLALPVSEVFGGFA